MPFHAPYISLLTDSLETAKLNYLMEAPVGTNGAELRFPVMVSVVLSAGEHHRFTAGAGALGVSFSAWLVPQRMLFQLERSYAVP